MSLDFANALKGGGGDNFAYLFRITPFYVSSLMCFLKKFLTEEVEEAKVFKKTIQYLSEFGTLEVNVKHGKKRKLDWPVKLLLFCSRSIFDNHVLAIG